MSCAKLPKYNPRDSSLSNTSTSTRVVKELSCAHDLYRKIYSLQAAFNTTSVTGSEDIRTLWSCSLLVRYVHSKRQNNKREWEAKKKSRKTEELKN